MKKYIRKHLKDEKRIIKLMYKKGMFEDLHISLNSIGWEYLYQGRRLRKGRGRQKHGGRDWLPELHVFSTNYWGETDSHSVIGILQEQLFWDNSTGDLDEMGFPKNSKHYSRTELIKYLTNLPTKINNNHIKSFLSRTVD